MKNFIICILFVLSVVLMAANKNQNSSAKAAASPAPVPAAASPSALETELSKDAKVSFVTSTSAYEKEGGGMGALLKNCSRDFAFHTEEEANPYLVITLKNPAQINKISIVNREDGCQERAKTLTIWVSEDYTTWKKCWSADGKTQAFWVVDMNKIKAKYIKVGLLENTAFHLKQLKIYGTYLN